MIRDHDTIAAPATAAGGALAVIRISGEEALRICDRIFRGRKPLAAAAGYTVHYGEIVDDGRVLDDVLVTVFRAPRSYTGEDAAEISCHGSQYIVSEILRLLTASGARMAGPGEFTIRAYLAKAWADLAAHEALLKETAGRVAAPDDGTVLAVLATKAACNEAALRITDTAMRVPPRAPQNARRSAQRPRVTADSFHWTVQTVRRSDRWGWQ